MRVCLATGSHPVDYTRFLHREAASLARAGHDVHLFGLEAADVCPPPGVTIHALKTRYGWAKRRFVRELALEVAGLGIDVCHCCDPWSLAAGLQLKRTGRCRALVYDSTEDFPSAYRARTDLSPVTRLLLTHAVVRLERRACREADVLIETNATRARRFAKFGREAVVVGNFPSFDAFPRPVAVRKQLFAYTGPITRHRGFLQLLDALELVRREYPNAGLKVIGAYDPRDNLRAQVEERLNTGGLSGAIRPLGTVSYEAMFQEIGECVAGVILLQPGRSNDYTGQPNKLFEFMGSGLVVIASDFPEIGPVLRREECGWLVDPTRPNAIAAAMASTLANTDRAAEMGQRGREAVRVRYNWAVAERALLAAYTGLAC